MYLPRKIFESMPRSGLIDLIQSYQSAILAAMFAVAAFASSIAVPGLLGTAVFSTLGAVALFFVCASAYYAVSAARTRGTQKR